MMDQQCSSEDSSGVHRLKKICSTGYLYLPSALMSTDKMSPWEVFYRFFHRTWKTHLETPNTLKGKAEHSHCLQVTELNHYCISDLQEDGLGKLSLNHT